MSDFISSLTGQQIENVLTGVRRVSGVIKRTGETVYAVATADDVEAVSYLNQSLSSAQKTQARDNIGAGTGNYSKPSGGIPKTDLASGVQESLDKADSALQSVPTTYRTAAAQDVIDAGKADDSDVDALNSKIAGQQRQITALKRLLEGVAYSTEEDTTPAYSKTVPTGAKAVSVNAFGGHSEVVEGEIVSAKVTDIESMGKNLAKPYSYSRQESGITFVSSEDGYIHAKGTATANAYSILSGAFAGKTYTLPAGTYTWSTKEELPNGVNVYLYRNGVGFNDKTFTLTEPAEVIHRLNITSGTTVNMDVHIQIERGSTSSSYSPYGVIDALTIPQALLTFLADKGYGRSAGSAYNEIDFERKKYIKRVGSVDLGTLTWSRNATGSGNYRFSSSERLNAKLPATQNEVPHAISAYYTVTRYGEMIATDKALTIIWADSYAAGQIWLRNDSYTDAAEFKAAMNGVMLYYELAEPVEYDISDYLPTEGFNLLSVESGGSLTFVQTDTELPVPNNTIYAVNLSEATT